MVFARHRISHVRRLGTGFGGYTMRVRAAGKDVGLVAVHTRPPLGDAQDWAADLNAVRGAAVDEGGPLMIVGDFNATLDHLPMRDLKGRGFDDAAAEARSRWQPTWPSAGEVSVLGVPRPAAAADRPRAAQPRPARGADRVDHRSGHRPPRAGRHTGRVNAAGSPQVWEPDEEDRAFLDVYGDWDPVTPAEMRTLMAGFAQPWWLVGGHAIEAFTGVARLHEDIDLVVFTDHVPQLRAQLGDRFHLWSNHGGTFRIIDDAHPEPLHPLSQIWMRENARSPWRIDCPLNPSSGGRWQSKRDASHVADLEEVTWVHEDGIRYLNPEITLFFKAAQARAKDEIDLGNAWPLLSTAQRTWLRDAVRAKYPDHAWNDLLAQT